MDWLQLTKEGQVADTDYTLYVRKSFFWEVHFDKFCFHYKSARGFIATLHLRNYFSLMLIEVFLTLQ